MLSLNAKSFFDAAMLIEETRTYIDALMEHDDAVATDKSIAADVSDHMKNACASLREALTVLDARITKMSVDRLLNAMDSSTVTFGKLSYALTEINRGFSTSFLW